MTEPHYVSMTRAAYDDTADIYAQLIGTEISPAVDGVLDRAILGSFVKSIAGADGQLVADVGCGPGRVAAFLAANGLNVIGFDISDAMLTIAGAAHPGIRFELGMLTDLPLLDGALAGAVCWYSIIHTPSDRLDVVVDELARVLAPGGRLLVAFQAGNGEPVHRADIHGRSVSLTSYRHHPDHVAGCLSVAGFAVEPPVIREAEFSHESTPQAFILATAPG